MPLVDGFEVLEWIRAQPAFRDLPVVVFTESNYEVHIRRALQLGATAFITKVVDLTEFELELKDVVERLLFSASPPPRVSTQLAQAA
jgi:CheY-like chemotaxis protein